MHGTSFLLILFIPMYVCDRYASLLSNESCAVRYTYLDQITKERNCTEMKETNSLCGRDIKVLYSELKPYIFMKNGTVTGLLPEILEEILVRSCCLGCNKITYNKTNNIIDTIWNHLHRKDFDILIPVENCFECNTFLGHYYKDLIQLDGVSFVGKTKAPTPEYLTRILIESSTNTWPLFVVALSLAITAGTIVWIMDTWVNGKEFPRQFPRGPFEGFWWAYVSMTTVGYGDRTPHSVPARLFAVIWILIGMIIFNMYTACITSLLTSKISEEGQNSLYMNKIGVLGDLKAIYSGTAKGFAYPEVYNDMEALKKDLDGNEIPAIAMENSMLTYYLSDEIGEKYTIYKEVKLTDNGLGLVSYQSQIIALIESFRKHNRDSMDTIVSNASKNSQSFKGSLANSDEKPTTFTLFSSNSNAFYITMGVTGALSVLCIILGTFLAQTQRELKRRRTKRNSKLSQKRLVDTSKL